MTHAGARRYIALTIALSLLFSLLPVGVMADTNLTGNASGQSLLSAGVSEETSSTKTTPQETLADTAKEEEGTAPLDESAELSGALSQSGAASPFSLPSAEAFAPLALPEGVVVGQVFDIAPFKYKITSETTVQVGDGTKKGGLRDNTLTSYSSLTIPSSVPYKGTTLTVTAVSNEAFREIDATIVSVSIPGSVSHIGAHAFREMPNVTEFFLNDGLTSIGQSAFQATVFKTITVPKSVTEYGDTVFRDNGKTLTGGEVIFEGAAPPDSITAKDQKRDFSFTVRFLNEDNSLADKVVVPKGTALPKPYPSVPSKLGYEAIWAPQDGHTLDENVITSFDVKPAYIPIVTIGETFEVAPFKYEILSSTTVKVGTGTVVKNGLSTGVDLNLYSNIIIPATVVGPNGLTFNVVEVNESAFDSISATLGSIEIPGSVKTIGQFAFRDIKYVSHLVLNEGLVSIGQAAFQNFVFTELVVPKSVTTYGENAFQDDGNKIPDDTVIFEGSAPTHSSVTENRAVSFTTKFFSETDALLFTVITPKDAVVVLPAAPAREGFPGAWLAQSGFSLAAPVVDSFAAKCMYPLNLTELSGAIDNASVLIESDYASGEWAAMKTAESRAQALYTMFSTRIANGEPVGVDGFDELGKTIANQEVVTNAAEMLSATIANLSARFAPEKQYFIGTTTATSYDAVTKTAGSALIQGTILSAQFDRLTGITEKPSNFTRFPSVEYTVYSPGAATWFRLAGGSYAKRADLQDYPILGFGGAYQVKVVKNAATNRMLPFDWSVSGEALPWGTLLNVQTVNDKWVVYTQVIGGKAVYRYISVDILTPTDPDAVVTAPAPGTDPNIWDPSSTPKDPGDPTVPGHEGYHPADMGGGSNPVSLVGAWPASGSTGVGLNERFYVAFENNVGGPTNPYLGGNLGRISLQKADGTSVPAKISSSPQDELKRYLFIQPLGQLEYGTNYKIVVHEGIRNKNGKISNQDYVISFATETNPYAAPGMGTVAAPSGNVLVFGSQAEAEGARTDEGADPGTTKPGTTKPGTAKPSKGNDGKPADKKTDDKLEGAKVEVASNNTAPVEPTNGADTIVPINAPSPQSESDEPSGNRAPIAPGVVAGIIAALAIVGALGGRQSIIAKRRREEEDSAAL